MLIKSCPGSRAEKSTGYTTPSCEPEEWEKVRHQLKRIRSRSTKSHAKATTSATWLSLVLLAPPRYDTFAPGASKTLSMPPNTPTANFLQNEFHTVYSIIVPSSLPMSIKMRLSPYTDSPGAGCLVTSIGSLPLAMKMPSYLCGSMIAFEPPRLLAPPRPVLLSPRPPPPPRPHLPPRPRGCTPPPA